MGLFKTREEREHERQQKLHLEKTQPGKNARSYQLQCPHCKKPIDINLSFQFGKSITISLTLV